jgi:hypothetical protein
VNLVDPDGKDDYYNEKAKYLGSDYRGTDNVRVMTQENWNRIQAEHREAIETLQTKESHQALIDAYDSKSRILDIEVAGDGFKDLWSRGNVNEAASLMIFDFDDAKLYLLSVAVTDATPIQCNIVGQHFAGNMRWIDSKNRLSLVIGGIHTHPLEHVDLGKKLEGGGIVTDLSNYKNQFKFSRDGDRAARYEGPVYTIGKDNVDFYSPKGLGFGKNNLTTRTTLENNNFNLLRYGLEVFGGKKDN